MRQVFRDHKVVNTLTTSENGGDFNKRVADNGIVPSKTGDPIILVLKKHTGVLGNVIDWVQDFGTSDEKGNKVLQDIPLMLIDDECDYASVDTKNKNEIYGKVDGEWDPAKTNAKIRKLLNSFSRKVYIGYTATPYANIFIHHESFQETYGEDLFPRHFLICLPIPTNYLGPEKLFGLSGNLDSGIKATAPLPLVRKVNDNETCIPSKIKPGDSITALPESLKQAVRAFLLSCSARRLRKEGTPHNTMLVHVARHLQAQKDLFSLLTEFLKKLTDQIQSHDKKYLDPFKKIWSEGNENDASFCSVSKEMIDLGYKDSRLHKWDEIRTELYEATRCIEIKQLNGNANDGLEYVRKNMEVATRSKRVNLLIGTKEASILLQLGGINYPEA